MQAQSDLQQQEDINLWDIEQELCQENQSAQPHGDTRWGQVFQCPVCHKMFTKKVDLERHSITHRKKWLEIAKLEKTETNTKEKVDATQEDETKGRIALLIPL